LTGFLILQKITQTELISGHQFGALKSGKKRSYCIHACMFCSNGRIGCKYCRDAKSLGPLTHTGVALSKLWSNAEIGDGGNNKSSTRLNSLGLRNKIHKHVSSAAHLLPCKTRESKEQKGLEEELEAQTVKVEHITECVFSHSKTQPAIH